MSSMCRWRFLIRLVKLKFMGTKGTKGSKDNELSFGVMYININYILSIELDEELVKEFEEGFLKGFVYKVFLSNKKDCIYINDDGLNTIKEKFRYLDASIGMAAEYIGDQISYEIKQK